MNERLWVQAGTLITPHCTFEGATIVARAGIVEDILPGQGPRPAPGDHVLDARGQIVGPGFIDLHVHGGGGHDAMDATPEALQGLAAFHARHGTTSLLPTTIAAAPEAIHGALEAIGAAMTVQPDGARVLGAHVEGPFLSEAKRGAHPAAQVRPPDRRRDSWLVEHLAAIRRLTLAPELPGALELVRELRLRGVLVSIGHSTAGEELVAAAVLAGATHVTHLPNAMTTMEKVGAVRRLGMAEAALLCDDLSVEVIADGWHVPLGFLKLVVRVKGVERTALVTDAMRAAGLAAGRYPLGGEGGTGVTVRDGMALTAEGGLAGSIAGMDELVRSAVRGAGLTLAEAWQMASTVPARILGISQRTGEVAVGKEADLAILSRELETVATVVGGRVVYRAG